MDTRTGEVMTEEEMKRRIKQYPGSEKFFRGVPPQPLREKTGRNDLCPCGSGKKFKKCCLTK